MKNLIFIVFLTIIGAYFVQCDVFTAMVDLENLLVSEAGTTSLIIDEYIKSESDRLQQLKK